MSITGVLSKICLIEDDGEDCEFFTSALKEISPEIQLECYTGCTDFFSKVNAFNPGLIFLDLHLPLKNGIDCLKEIRESPLTGNIPIVIYTGASANHDMLSKSINLGAKMYFEKPADHNQLVNSLRNVLTHNWSIPDHISPVHIKEGNFIPLKF